MPKSKDSKPEVEDIIGDVLSGEALKNASELIAYLRQSKINPLWSAENVWKISYKGYCVCFIRLYGAAHYHCLEAGTWHIVPFIGEYDVHSLSDEYKEIVWADKTDCPNCGKCALVISKVFGKKYNYACEKSIVFTNPDAKSVECVKKLIELRRSDIKQGTAKKHQYIPMKLR